MALWNKRSHRRTHVRRSLTEDRVDRWAWFFNTDVILSLFLWLCFVVLTTAVISFDDKARWEWMTVATRAVFVATTAVGMGFYIHHFQHRLVSGHARAAVLGGLMVGLLLATQIGIISAQASWATSWVVGSAVVMAMILTIACDQRFAIGMGGFYALIACLAAGTNRGDPYRLTGLALFCVALSGVLASVFSLREIRTRMKLLEVSALTGAAVFLVAGWACYDQVSHQISTINGAMPSVMKLHIVQIAGCHAGFALLAGLCIHTFLPLIEKALRIATSMTLLDLSDANHPLLKKLALEAPGTFSHSLLIGSIAEAAAEAIGCNGLLCRVGAYYHDVGKIPKAGYFVENEMGSISRHKELSPTMSQLIIVGHVKDGIEMAKEYRLPRAIREFMETHHGTTLVAPFYREAQRQFELDPDTEARREAPPSESEFRYPGPKPKTREAAIVMLADAAEGAVRSLGDVTASRVEAVVHTIAMKRLQDGQFDDCDITLRELSQVEAAMAKVLAAHYHGRIAYPTAPDQAPTELSLDRRPSQVSP